MIETTIPTAIKSEANRREHWAKKHKRSKSQKEAVLIALLPFTKPTLPCIVKFIHQTAWPQDGDNLQRSFKACRDSVASWLGIDDADSRVTWLYEQQKINKRNADPIVQITSL